MVKELFTVRQTKDRNETKFAESGTEKLNVITFKGVDNEGIVTQVTFKGSPEAMAKKFAGFIGSTGDVELTMSTSTTQQSLPTALANASKAAKGKKSKTKAGEDEDDEFDKSMLALGQQTN